tara:strand:+ start:5059 stop:6291 length:1233 start_codon:yes stop_codon:yes gene_type:complete
MPSRKEKAAYQNTLAANQYQDRLNDYNAAVANDQVAVDLVNQQRDDGWNQQEALRQLQIETAAEVYEKDNQVYEQGLQFVDRAYDYAVTQEELALDQRLMELMYQSDDLDRAFTRDSLGAAYKSKELDFMLQQTQLDSQLLNIQNERTQANYIADMKEQSLDMSSKAAETRLSVFESSLEGQAAKGAAAASGRRGKTAAQAKAAAVTAASIDQGKLTNALQRASFSFNNVTTKLTSNKTADDKTFTKNKEKNKITQNSIKNQKEEIQTMLGLTAEQYASDTEKLGQMMLDQEAQFMNAIRSLDNKKFNSKSQLYASKLMPPRFPDAAPRPSKVQYTNFAKPSPPQHVKKGMLAGAPSSNSPSTTSTILGIGGAALGVAAAAAGPLGWGAGWAAGLGGASTVAGGLSQLWA